MNLMEMVLALLAVVFFSTIALMYKQSVWDQNELLINAQQYVQASHLSHTVLDEVDAKLFSKQLTFAGIKTTYNTQRTLSLAHTGGQYILNITAVSTDSLGTVLASPPANNIYTRVTVRTATAGLKTPVTMSRLYTKTHLNL